MKKIIQILMATTISATAIAQQVKYFATEKQNVSDNYFGTTIQDPYRWLEDDTSAATAKWVEQQNSVTNNYLNQIPYRKNVKESLSKLWNYARYSAPFKKGDYYYFYKNDGLQNQSILYRQQGLKGKPEIFLDPNNLSKDGTAALGSISFSKNNKLMAYTVSQSGSDWQDIYIMDVATKKILIDKITNTKFTGISWYGDNTFFYSGYDKPKNEGTKYSAVSEYQKIFKHNIGDNQLKDALIFEDKEHPLLYKSVGLTEDNKFIILYLSEGTDGTALQYAKIDDVNKVSFKPLFNGYAYNYTVVDNIGEDLLVHTNNGASNYNVVKVNPAKPNIENWKIIIPEKKEKLDGVLVLNNQIVASYLKDACSKVDVLDMNGKAVSSIASPGYGTISGLDGSKNDTETFYSFSTFAAPPTIFRYDLKTGKSTAFIQSDPKFNASDVEVKFEKYTTADGNVIPMFLVYKKGTDLKSGNTPVFMYGYGGFNVSLTPSFSVPINYFVQQGGVYCMVILRGGGEYGEDWHTAGMLGSKQNVFNDFIGVAEHLIKIGVTNKEKIAIHGRSNGGLLIGACITQRPDLFKVALPGVGVLDMLRYHKFTVGWGWAVEYGSSDKKEDFDYLIKYSPLHNVKPNKYPATLITTADHDDRVVPAHSFKFAATLQENQKGNLPALIRIDSKAGHGAGKPITKQIDEWTDVLSFTMFNLKMNVR